MPDDADLAERIASTTKVLLEIAAAARPRPIKVSELGFVSSPDAARMLEKKPATLRAWRSQLRGPACYLINGVPQYKVVDIACWIEESKGQRR